MRKPQKAELEESMVDLEATKANFAEFLSDVERSQRFLSKRYRGDLDKKKFPLIAVVFAIFLCLTVVAIPAGLIVLYYALTGRKSAREKYLDRFDRLSTIQTFVVAANSEIADPANMGAALVVGSFDPPTPELEELCRDITTRLQHLFEYGPDSEGEDQELYDVVANDDAVRGRRREIPNQYTSGHKILALDVVIERAVTDYHRDPREVVAIGNPLFGDLETIPVECVVRTD